MVYPVNNIKFYLLARSSGNSLDNGMEISDMESLSIEYDNGIEEWNPIGSEGWVNRLQTARSMSVTISGKRNYDDDGNNFVASLAYSDSDLTRQILVIEFPDKSKFKMPCVVNLNSAGGGDSTSLGELSFTCLSDGKPLFVEAS